MTASGIEGGGKAGDYVDLFQEAADDFRSVVLRTQLLEVAHDASECRLNVGDGTLRKIGPLLL